jgi:hypothetical protein
MAGGAFNWVFLNRWPDGAVVEAAATRAHLYGPALDWTVKHERVRGAHRAGH